MKIVIIDKIDDNFLIREWKRLESESNIFPQSTYEWCATWWQYFCEKRELHVVIVLNAQGNALAIAPLCIEHQFGVRILRSFPIHFADFYSFIISNEESSVAAIDEIIEYITSNISWRWARLDQIINKSIMFKALDNHHYIQKEITACVIVDIANKKWEDYLAELKINFRRNIRSRLRKINADFKVELNEITGWIEFNEKFNEMVKMHQDRWIDDFIPSKGTVELECWKEAIMGQFKNNQMVYYELIFNDNPVAYRLGFIYKNTYFDWHTSFNPQYRQYHVGQMILAYMIKHFMENSILQINFMAGKYNWKLDWSPNHKTAINYMFSTQSNNCAALVLNWYHNQFRDKLKAVYHGMMHRRLLRSISRIVLCLRQKL